MLRMLTDDGKAAMRSTTLARAKRFAAACGLAGCVAGAMFAGNGCASKNSPPSISGARSGVPEQGYFLCSKCQSLDGGYYGSTSVISWRSRTGRTCRHDWQPIPPEQFEELLQTHIRPPPGARKTSTNGAKSSKQGN